MKVTLSGRIIHLPVSQPIAKSSMKMHKREFIKGTPFGGPSNGRVFKNSPNWDK